MTGISKHKVSTICPKIRFPSVFFLLKRKKRKKKSSNSLYERMMMSNSIGVKNAADSYRRCHGDSSNLGSIDAVFVFIVAVRILDSG